MKNNVLCMVQRISVMTTLLLLIVPMAFAQVKSADKAETKSMKCENCAPKTATKKSGHDPCAVARTMTLSGLDCPGCASGIKSALAEVTGVEEVTVDVKTQKAVVWVCPHKNVTSKALTDAVTGAGFKVVRIDNGQPDSSKAKAKKTGVKRG